MIFEARSKEASPSSLFWRKSWRKEDREEGLRWIVDGELGYYAYDGESVENGRRKRGKATRVTRDYHIAGLGPSDFIHIRRYCLDEVTSRASSWLTVDHWNPPLGRKLSVSLKRSFNFLVREKKKKLRNQDRLYRYFVTQILLKNDSFSGGRILELCLIFHNLHEFVWIQLSRMISYLPILIAIPRY